MRKSINEFTWNSVLQSLSVIAVITTIFSQSALAQRETMDRFLTKLFSPVELVKIGVVIPQQYPQLDELDKENLLKAKIILVDFLKSFKQRDQDPLKFLHPLLRKKYKDRYTLYQQEFGAEIILEMKIYNFVVKGQNKDEIVLYTALTDATEGDTRTYKTAFALKKYKETWKILRFRQDIKYWEKELRE